MSYTNQQLINSLIICTKPEHGSATYYLDGKAICFALCSSDGNNGNLCSRPAGIGTDHPSTGRCKDHGGRNGLAPLAVGRYAPVLNQRLNELYQKYANDPDLLDLTPELMLLRAILGNFLEFYQDVNLAEPDNLHAMGTIVSLVDKVSKQVERIERIDANHILTVATAKLIMVKGMNVGKRYVESDLLDAFLEEWQTDVLKPISTTTYQVLEGE